MKAAKRIMNAVLYGNNPRFKIDADGEVTMTHPLSKSPCPVCEEPIMAKDMKAHLAEHEREMDEMKERQDARDADEVMQYDREPWEDEAIKAGEPWNL